MDAKLLITNISSVITLAPLLIGVVAFRKSNNTQRAFLYYLCLAFSIDFVQVFISNQNLQNTIYNVYAVIEICFLLWFIRQLSSNKKAKKNYLIILYFVIPLWLVCHFISAKQFLSFNDFSKWFDGIMALTIALITAFEILNITQQHDEKSFRVPQLWFQGALFMYFFSTFFIFFLMETSIRSRIWFIHNLINVVECVLLVAAYYTIYKYQQKTKALQP